MDKLSSKELILGWLDGLLDMQSVYKLMVRLKERDVSKRTKFIPFLKYQARARLKSGAEKTIVKDSLVLFYDEEDAFSLFSSEVGAEDTKCDHVLWAYLHDERSKELPISELLKLMVRRMNDIFSSFMLRFIRNVLTFLWERSLM